MAVETAPFGSMQDWSASGSGKNGRIGILFIHGFTGAPPSMRPWGEFFLAQGYSVKIPLLPGHGTRPEDLNNVTWQEWPDKVQSELDALLTTCDQVFLAGLSMGGGTALYIATHNNDRISGIILVNPMIHLPRVSPFMAYMLSRFQKMRPSVGNDIKRPDITEHGYDVLPTRGIHQLLLMLRIARKNLGKITVPVLLFHSAEDHTLPVSNTEIVMAGLGSVNKERIELVDSYHVATLDNDQELIFQKSLTFIEGLSKQ